MPLNKMYLVSTDQYQQPQQQQQQQYPTNPYTEKLIELENELRQILTNELLDVHQKAILYGQVLQKMLNFKSQEQESRKLKVEIQQQPQLPLESPLPPPPKEEDEVEEPRVKKISLDIIETAPKTDKLKLVKLINNLPKSVGWNSQGQLTLYNQVIPGSNIKNLLQGHVSRGKKKQKLAKEDLGYPLLRAELQQHVPASSQQQQHQSQLWLNFDNENANME
jgi:hypothetical protein